MHWLPDVILQGFLPDMLTAVCPHKSCHSLVWCSLDSWDTSTLTRMNTPWSMINDVMGQGTKSVVRIYAQDFKSEVVNSPLQIRENKSDSNVPNKQINAFGHANPHLVFVRRATWYSDRWNRDWKKSLGSTWWSTQIPTACILYIHIWNNIIYLSFCTGPIYTAIYIWHPSIYIYDIYLYSLMAHKLP